MPNEGHSPIGSPAAQDRPLAVCSWSLRPRSPSELVRLVRATGLSGVQLALDPIARGEWKEDETFARLRDAGLRVVSAMLAPAGEDYSTLESIRATGGVRRAENFAESLRAAHQIADICARHSIPLCTFHAGALPDGGAERHAMIARLARMVRAFHDPDAGRHVGVAFESGQETPEGMVALLGEVRAALEGTPAAKATIGVNFDPANIILYDVGDPLAAFRAVQGDVLQVHIKDARATDTPGTWGTETPAGQGQVAWPAFLAAVRAASPHAGLVVEREGGEARVGDVRTAAALVHRTLGAGDSGHADASGGDASNG
ncbi:MAG: sugar phosphate isomerase/epimerase [Phycisphaerales bacterium]|nr:sugar phosphate isomerase/epimerase [Phycisphaerales bacterium]